MLLWLNVWLAPPGRWQTVVLMCLVVGLGFTGFGLTTLPPLMAMVLLDVWRGSGPRLRALAVLAAGLLTLAAFLYQYQWVVSAEGFEVLRPDLTGYLQFMAAMAGHFLLAVQHDSPWYLYPAGTLLLACWALTLAWGTWVLARPSTDRADDRLLWQVCVVLVGGSLLFTLLTTYGRSQLGVGAAMASRYTALLLPGLLAVYLLLFRQRAHWPVSLLALLLLFSARVLPETREAWLVGRYYASLKEHPNPRPANITDFSER